MKPKLFARVIMYAVLVFLLILWMYPIVIAIVKSVQVADGRTTLPC